MIKALVLFLCTCSLQAYALSWVWGGIGLGASQYNEKSLQNNLSGIPIAVQIIHQDRGASRNLFQLSYYSSDVTSGGVRSENDIIGFSWNYLLPSKLSKKTTLWYGVGLSSDIVQKTNRIQIFTSGRRERLEDETTVGINADFAAQASYRLDHDIQITAQPQFGFGFNSGSRFGFYVTLSHLF